MSEGAAQKGTMGGATTMLSRDAPSDHRIHNAVMRLSGREPPFYTLSGGDQVTIRAHKTDVSKVWAY